MKALFPTLALFAVSLAACQKSDINPEPLVIGQIMDSSGTTPYANTAFILYTAWKEGTIPGTTKEQVVPFTTDNAGKFSVKFNTENSRGIFLTWPGGATSQGYDISMYLIPLGDFPDTIDMGVIHAKRITPE